MIVLKTIEMLFVFLFWKHLLIKYTDDKRKNNG